MYDFACNFAFSDSGRVDLPTAIRLEVLVVCLVAIGVIVGMPGTAEAYSCAGCSDPPVGDFFWAVGCVSNQNQCPSYPHCWACVYTQPPSGPCDPEDYYCACFSSAPPCTAP